MAMVLQTGKCALLHPDTAHELLREHDKELKVLTTYSPDPSLIEHPWDVSKQVRSMEAIPQPTGPKRSTNGR